MYGVGHCPSFGTGAGWQLNGINRAADWNLGTANNASPAGLGLGWIFGDQHIDVKDKENWAQADGETLPNPNYSLGARIITSSLGYNPRAIYMWTFAAGAALSGLAGGILAFVGLEAVLISTGLGLDLFRAIFAAAGGAAWVGLMILFIVGGMGAQMMARSRQSATPSPSVSV